MRNQSVADRSRRSPKPIGKVCEIRRRITFKLKRMSRFAVLDKRLMRPGHVSKKPARAAVVHDPILSREHHQHRQVKKGADWRAKRVRRLSSCANRQVILRSAKGSCAINSRHCGVSVNSSGRRNGIRKRLLRSRFVRVQRERHAGRSLVEMANRCQGR